MNLEGLDFTDCLYDPIKKNYEDLERYPEFKEKIGSLKKEKIITYIIAVYDMKSPLKREIPDWVKRKKEGMIFAGYNLDKKNNFPKSIEDVVLNLNEKVNKMIIRYIKLFNSPDYTELVTYHHIFNKMCEVSLSGMLDKPKENLQVIRDTSNFLREKEKIVFGGEETIDLKKSLYEDIDSEMNNVQVENIAQLLSGGDDLSSFSPYEGYDAKDDGYKFIGDE